jgi:hypothetical protein
MLMQKCVAVDNHSFDVLQRAFDGACWSVGISRCPRQGEIEDISETRKAIALTVLRCAAAGARDVQALKASALRCLFGKAALNRNFGVIPIASNCGRLVMSAYGPKRPSASGARMSGHRC